MVIKTIQNGTKPTSLCVLDRYIFEKYLGQDQRLADFTVRGIDFENRADELSPWPAQSTLCKHNVTVFSGQADATYELLQNRYDGTFAHTVFAGYSLSALFLLYALTLQTKQKCAGYILISPSVWYERFDSYFLERVAAGAVKSEKSAPVSGRLTYEFFGKSTCPNCPPVKKYLEESEGTEEIKERKAEVTRLAMRCEGARKTTGQHPGGMIVVPKDKSIYDFCPIQRPANDMKSNFKTTHFDYHVMDEQLVKLDILGHDDPTTLRILQDLTGVDIYKIPLDDKEVMSLFSGTQALGVTPDDIGSPTGTSGIPEFGTSFVKQMLVDTRPKTFAELVRISGLSHGTDVWLNNAQDYVRSGVATLSQIITVRDDIMNKLIDDGLDKSLAFKIMEFVRKGRPTKDPDKWKEYSALMKEKGVEQWYIDSCEKIKYMFPKGHAVAYVMMAVRIAYFKVHYPVEFYAAFLNRKVGDFKMTTMFFEKKKSGTEEDSPSLKKLKNLRRELESNPNLNAKQKQELFLYEILIEMNYRNIELAKPNVLTSNAKFFTITEDKKIQLPLIAVDGLGESVAEKIVSEREKDPFLSLEDLTKRTKLNKTVLKILEDYECVEGIQKENQGKLF